jgi:DNA modification methylase
VKRKLAREPRDVLSSIDWDFRNYVPLADGAELQRLHWYPAPFPPALAGTLVEILGDPHDRVLDPFSGSGVAPIEAWLRRMEPIGIDNNSFAIEISRAKVQLAQAADAGLAGRLATAYQSFRTLRRHALRSTKLLDLCYQAGIHDDAPRWFAAETLREVAIAKQWIEESRGAVRVWRDVLRVVLSSTLFPQLSTVRRYHYTYVVDRSRVNAEDHSRVDVAAIFMSRLMRLCVDAELIREQLKRLGTPLELLGEVSFRKGRAQDETRNLPRIDLVITSPPYFGMNDYVRSQYLSWLIFQWQDFDTQIASESGSRRSRNSVAALEAYFADMRSVFGQVRSVLKPGGFLAVVVGRSRARALQSIDIVAVLQDIIQRSGFDLYWMGARRVRFRKINNVPYAEEHIRVFT